MGTSRRSHAAAFATALISLAGLTSCTSSTKTAPSNDPQANAKSSPESVPGTGLNHLAADNTSKSSGQPTGKPTSADIAAMADENARLMREIRESVPRTTPRTPAEGSPGIETGAANPNAPAAGLAALSGGAITPAATSASTSATSASELIGPAAPAGSGTATDPEAQVFAAADELVRTLRDRAGTGKAPLRDYLALAWLDAVRPGSLGALDSGPVAARIDPNQARSIALARDFAQALYGNPEAMKDPERVWATLQKAAEPVLAARDLSIAAVDLCSRVDGYGQYAPISSRTFQAGVAHSIIVYTEVENFAHRVATDPASGGERFAVDLGVAVEVWQDADKPTLQKRWSEAGVTETSRRKRRDFFVTNLIELPKALSVGAYTLKIIVSDRVKGAVAEKVIPFTIVADAATSQPSR